MKKITFTVGMLATIVTPIATVVSCSEPSPTGPTKKVPEAKPKVVVKLIALN